jgi:NMD protein affecting ribosome stability and mRNA decay
MKLGKEDYAKIGDYNAMCDRCAKKAKASTLVKEWTGFMVCEPCHEPRHPQDLIRSIPEKPVPPFTRPQPTDRFIVIMPVDPDSL